MANKCEIVQIIFPIKLLKTGSVTNDKWLLQMTNGDKRLVSTCYITYVMQHAKTRLFLQLTFVMNPLLSDFIGKFFMQIDIKSKFVRIILFKNEINFSLNYFRNQTKNIFIILSNYVKFLTAFSLLSDFVYKYMYIYLLIPISLDWYSLKTHTVYKLKAKDSLVE